MPAGATCCSRSSASWTLRRRDLRYSAAMLREYGNLSSAFVYFVLQAALADDVRRTAGGGCPRSVRASAATAPCCEVQRCSRRGIVAPRSARRPGRRRSGGDALAPRPAARPPCDGHALASSCAPCGDMTSSARRQPLRVLELGAGDGSLMLGVARALAPRWPPVELTLLDRQALVDAATPCAAIARCGWTVATDVMRRLDWAPDLPKPWRGAAPHWDLIVANLFLHHFDGDRTRTRCWRRLRPGRERVLRLRAAPQPAGARRQSPDRRHWRQRR